MESLKLAWFTMNAPALFIGIFDFVADGDTTGDDGYLHIIGGEFAVDEKVRRVALHCRTERQDDFLHVASGNPLYQAVDLQIARTYPVHREMMPPRT